MMGLIKYFVYFIS